MMNSWFDEKYKEGLTLGGRYDTMSEALQLLLNKKPTGGIFVETGCIRMKDDWGAGMSTLVFADVCKRNNSHLFTVDNNPDALYVCRNITKEFAEVVTYVENDSVAFLQEFNQSIDFLYLDSMDCPEYDAPTSTRLIQSQIHQLTEMQTAIDKLSSDPVILLDDNQFENGGKTRLTKVFLQERGFTERASGKQSLWTR